MMRRLTGLAHDAQIDGVERDHREDAREQSGNLELRAEEARDDAGERARDAGDEDGGDGMGA